MLVFDFILCVKSLRSARTLSPSLILRQQVHVVKYLCLIGWNPSGPNNARQDTLFLLRHALSKPPSWSHSTVLAYSRPAANDKRQKSRFEHA